MNYTKEQRLEAYKRLPEAIKEVIGSIDSVMIINDIAKKHSLHVDQLGQLAEEVGLVMFGLSDTNEFKQNIQNKLHIDPDKAWAVTQDINNEIFIKIREAVKKASSDGATRAIPPQAPPQEELLKIEPKPTQNVFEQKVGQMFSLQPEKKDIGPIKPWEQDPYLEKP